MLNAKNGRPTDAVFIGRPSIFGNPYVIGKDGTREQVIQKYKDYFYSIPDLMLIARHDLRGKDLVCFCAPLPCHGDILLEYANEEIDTHQSSR